MFLFLGKNRYERYQLIQIVLALFDLVQAVGVGLSPVLQGREQGIAETQLRIGRLLQLKV